MKIEDFIVFGRTVPERSKKYGHSVCMAGYSKELGEMIRVYPLNIKSKVKARKILNLDVERNKDDTRKESWALKGRTERSILDTSNQAKPKQLQNILQNITYPSITELNENKLSLGVLQPNEFEIVMKSRSEVNEHKVEAFDEFANHFKTGADYTKIPYLKMKIGDRTHCIQMREWGIFELLRKYEKEGKSTSQEDIKNALHIREDRETYFAVGNMYRFRNNWLVIKTFTFKR